MKDLKIVTTNDYEALVPIFIANDLEFSEEEPVPTESVQCWKAEAEDGSIQGGAVLAVREGEYIVDGLAVNKKYRSSGAGRKLMESALDEARRRGGKRVFIVARAPRYFEKIGYVTVERKDAPQFFECFTCPQYGKNCFPEVMRYDLI